MEFMAKIILIAMYSMGIISSVPDVQAQPIIEESEQDEVIEEEIDEPPEVIEEEVIEEEPVVEETPPIQHEVNVCNPYTNVVTYMDYRCNGEHTAQWQYQINAITIENGLRSSDGFIHVALAKPYGDLGTKYIIRFENGIQLPVIMVEWKGDTDCTHPDGSMLEFVVDSNYVNINAYQSRITKMILVE